MKRYRYFLDSIMLNNSPRGWDKLKQKIHFVPELNARLLKIDVDLAFHGDGFRYLLQQYNTLGHCGLVNIEIQERNNDLQTYRVVHIGYIFLSGIGIDRKEMLISCPIEDNSFYARINNNKSIETFVWAEKSKNNIQIPGALASLITFTNPLNCLPSYTLSLTFGFYRVFDLFTYLVDFVGDGLIDFESSLFDVGGDFEGLIVTCGYAVRLATGGLQEDPFKENFQKLSFLKLFQEVNKKIHIGMRIETSAGRPVLRIERDSYFRQTNIMHTCANIDRVTESIAVDQLYSKIKLGSTVTDNAASLSFPEDITFLGFKEEEFIVLGECNIDRELNLVSDFVISSNIIEDCIINGATSYDTNFFFVMTEPIYGFYVTKTGNVFGDALPCQFNLDLTNVNVTQNWVDGIPNSMAQYIADPTDLFKAQRTPTLTLLDFSAASNTTAPIPYNDDSSPGFFDTNGDYDAVTDFDFTSPADGSYSFRVLSMFRSFMQGAPSSGVDITATITVSVFDPINPVSQTSTTTTWFQPRFGTINTTFNWYTPAVYIQSGYRAHIEINILNTGWINVFSSAVKVDLMAGSFWQCIGSQQGGIVQGIDPANYPVIGHEYEQELTPDEFDAINADSRGLIDCTTHRDYAFQAWLKELEFDRAKGMAKFKLYSTKNLNG